MTAPKHSYKSFKIGFNSLIRDDKKEFVDALNERLLQVNKIVYHTYSFIKLYFIHLKTNNIKLPVLNIDFINTCFKLFYTTKKKGEKSETNQKTFNKLKTFCDTYYYSTVKTPLPTDCSHVGNFLKYEAKDILTNYKNIMSTSFVNKVRKYIDNHFKLYEQPGSEKQTLKSELSKVKDDVLTSTNKSLEKYLPFINELRVIITPKRKVLKNSILYDIKAKPLDYLTAGITLGLNVFPLRRSFIPSYITLEYESLQLLTGNKINGQKRNKEEKFKLWNEYFKLDEPKSEIKRTMSKYKKRGFEFSSLMTDLVGCSIILERENYENEQNEQDEYEYIFLERDVNTEEEKYIDEVKLNNTKNIVGIDPGKDDLIHCTNGKDFFRYTNAQRKRETNRPLYNRKKRKQRRKAISVTLFDGSKVQRSIENIEANLGTSKNSNLSDTLNYTINKNNSEHELRELYNNKMFRTTKWRTFILTQKSESKMINNFKKKMGCWNEVDIAIGDWTQKERFKFKEPTLGKGVRNIFKRNKYDVYLVDEFRTSALCYSCCSPTEKCIHQPDPRPKKEGKIRQVHGLLRCTSCNKLWNRDVNGSLNIRQNALDYPNIRPNFVRGVEVQPRTVNSRREIKNSNLPGVGI